MASEGSSDRDRAGAAGRRGPEAAAAILSVLWVVATIGALVLFGGAGLTSFAIVMLSTAIVLPLAVIWLYVFALRLTATIAENDARMHAAIDSLRRALARPGSGGSGGADPDPADLSRQLAGIAEAQGRAEAALSRLAAAPRTAPAARAPAAKPAARQAPRPAPPKPAASAAETPADQATMAIETPEPGGSELDMAELISALQFPADADDAAGFRALRRAMQDRRTAQLVTAAQDVLTLLSQDGVYMDDLAPDPPAPEAWRRFAAGQRGDEIEALASIADEMTLSAVGERMRKDTIFRDAVHHFLRLFDHRFAGLAERMSDAEVAAMMDTRTGRAFMLLGRSAGSFR